MSKAFVRENDENLLLHHVKPTIPELVKYIKAGTAHTPVFVKWITKINGRDVVALNNGLSFFINQDNNWEMCL